MPLFMPVKYRMTHTAGISQFNTKKIENLNLMNDKYLTARMNSILLKFRLLLFSTNIILLKVLIKNFVLNIKSTTKTMVFVNYKFFQKF